MKVISSSMMCIDDIEPSARREILDRYGSLEAYCTEQLIAERDKVIEIFRRKDIIRPREIICVSASFQDQAGPKNYRRYPCMEAVLEELCHGVFTLGYGKSRVNNINNDILMLYTEDMLYYFKEINSNLERIKYPEYQQYKYNPDYLEALLGDEEVVQYIYRHKVSYINGKEAEIKYAVKKPNPHNKGWSKYGKGTQRRPRKEPYKAIYYPYNPNGPSLPCGKGRYGDVQGIQEGDEGWDD